MSKSHFLFQEGRNIIDFPVTRRKYKQELNTIKNVQEALEKFSQVAPVKKIDLGVANSYRLEISIDGILSYGLDNM
jgi:hypothetical protein